MSKHLQTLTPQKETTILAGLNGRSLALVGMMGAGKTAVGKRIAARLGLPFHDADAEIEAAAQKTIAEIFATKGEAFFRDKEALVITRLLTAKAPIVMATGGGAYMHPDTRETIRTRAVSIWLRADLNVLMGRVQRKANRPLLKTADPEATLKELMQIRHPIYAQADIVVDSLDVSHEAVLDAVLKALVDYFQGHQS